MYVSRRKFLKHSLEAIGLSLTTLELLSLTEQDADAAQLSSMARKILVVVQLNGGNDGLNTVVPYGFGRYYEARADLAVLEAEVLDLNGKIGLHPNMKGMHDLFKERRLAVVQAVGYPTPSRSHVRSMEIWQTAHVDQIAETGWLGRYLDLAASSDVTPRTANSIIGAINVGPTLPKTLHAQKVIAPSVVNPDESDCRPDHQRMVAKLNAAAKTGRTLSGDAPDTNPGTTYHFLYATTALRRTPAL